jgi:hypothetical protein
LHDKHITMVLKAEENPTRNGSHNGSHRRAYPLWTEVCPPLIEQLFSPSSRYPTLRWTVMDASEVKSSNDCKREETCVTLCPRTLRADFTTNFPSTWLPSSLPIQSRSRIVIASVVSGICGLVLGPSVLSSIVFFFPARNFFPLTRYPWLVPPPTRPAQSIACAAWLLAVPSPKPSLP